jgi:hypothetical protein
MASLYETDFYAWTQEQAGMLHNTLIEGLDLENLAIEVEAMGDTVLLALKSNLVRLLEHLLKWQHSPAKNPRRGWKHSIIEHRLRILDSLEGSKRLQNKLPELISQKYKDARKLALAGLEEDGIATSLLPQECPWSVEEILNEDFFP